MLNTFIAAIDRDFDMVAVINAIIAKGFNVIQRRGNSRFLILKSDKSLSELIQVPGVKAAEEQHDWTTPEKDRNALFKKK